MKEFRLNTATLRSIQATTGLDASVIATSDISTIEKSIERRIGTTPRPSFNVGAIMPRGSVYLMFRRLFTPQEIDRRLDKIRK